MERQTDRHPCASTHSVCSKTSENWLIWINTSTRKQVRHKDTSRKRLKNNNATAKYVQVLCNVHGSLFVVTRNCEADTSHVSKIFWVLMMSPSFCFIFTKSRLNSRPSPWKDTDTRQTGNNTYWGVVVFMLGNNQKNVFQQDVAAS